jgi:hypothetical protein
MKRKAQMLTALIPPMVPAALMPGCMVVDSLVGGMLTHMSSVPVHRYTLLTEIIPTVLPALIPAGMAYTRSLTICS